MTIHLRRCFTELNNSVLRAPALACRLGRRACAARPDVGTGIMIPDTPGEPPPWLRQAPLSPVAHKQLHTATRGQAIAYPPVTHFWYTLTPYFI